MAQRRRVGLRAPLLAVLVIGAGTVACDDSAPEGPQGPIPPSVFIRQPEDRTFVPASFEINGGLGGSVQDIDVAIDGVDLGPARRGQESGDWRFPAELVSITPGPHHIVVTASGEGGTTTASAWVYYDTEGLPFEVVVEPESTTYETGDTAIADDPALLLFGPADDPVTLDMSTSAPSQIRARVNDRLSTGSLASLDLDIRDDTPGSYVATAIATGPDGTQRQASHTVIILEPITTTTTANAAQPTTQPPVTNPPGAPSAVFFDDFEGADQWTATVVTATNGSSDTVELVGGGNPGTFRQMTHVLPGTSDGDNNPSQIQILHLFGGGEWNPALQGALSHINYAEDQIQFDPPFDGAAIGSRFALVQGGTTYLASIIEDNAYRNTDWQTVQATGLTAADFTPAPGPDFSENGAPMTFGVLRSNTSRSSSGITTTHGVDNWTVELFKG